MPSPSRPARRPRSIPSRRKGPAVKAAAATREIALRCRAGAERKVRAALAPLGTVEADKRGGILILHRGPKTSAADVRSAVSALEKDGLVEYVTPVTRDRDSDARQVLTGEITVRLKSGVRAKQTLASLKAEHGVEVKRRNEFEPTQYIVCVPDPSGTNTRDIARSLDRRSDVEFAAPNFVTDIRKRARARN
jgi:hypothetical protein